MNNFGIFVRLIFLAIFCLSTSFFAFSQESNVLLRISPKLRVNDSKKVKVASYQYVSVKDSVTKNNINLHEIQLKVLESKADYLIQWTNLSHDSSLFLFQSSEENEASKQTDTVVLAALKKAEIEVLQSNFHFKMNKQLSEIKQWTNGLETMKGAEFHQKKIVREYCLLNKIPEEQRIKLELAFSKQLEQAYVVWEEMLLAKAIDLFKAYTYSFKMNQTWTEKIFTKDIMMVNDGVTEFPGVLTTEATEVNGKLVLERKIDYDKEFAADYLQSMSSTLDGLSHKEVQISENEEAVIDVKSTWLVNYSKNLYFEVKGMKTITRTTFTFF